MRQVDLAGAAHLEMVAGVVQLRPEDAMVEAMLRGWQAQQAARGLREDTITARERLMRRVRRVHQRVPVVLDTGACGRVVIVDDRRAAAGAIDDPRLPAAACGCSPSS